MNAPTIITSFFKDNTFKIGQKYEERMHTRTKEERVRLPHYTGDHSSFSSAYKKEVNKKFSN